MKNIILIFLCIFFESCSIQNITTDDVYYSSNVKIVNTRYIDLNDRYLYMKTRGAKWNNFDEDFSYWNINRLNYLQLPRYIDIYTSSYYRTSLYPYNIKINNNNNNLYKKTEPRKINLDTYKVNSRTVTNTTTIIKNPPASGNATIRKFN